MKEESKDIQQPVTEDDCLEAWNETPHPQDELPSAVVRDYMLRDYRRMFEMYHKYRKLAAMNARQIEQRAQAIACKRKSLTQQLVDMQLKLEERDRKINDMYDRIRQKENMIDSLRSHCANQRDAIAALSRNVGAQRQQIQSLLRHYDDAGERFGILAESDLALNPEKWKQAVVELSDLRQAAGDMYDVIDSLQVDDGVRKVLKDAVRIIRGRARRGYNATARIANTVLRQEFGAEYVPEDGGGEESDNT